MRRWWAYPAVLAAALFVAWSCPRHAWAADAKSSSANAERSASVRPMKSRYFSTSDGVRLHVLEAAPVREATDGPVLAFVPGWSMPASIWHGQLQALATRYRTAALDPRGQGRSDIPAEGYTLERRARDIAEFVARYPKVVLIGWSLGALEVLQYVHQFGDESVDALILVDSSVGEIPAPPPGNFTETLQQDRAKALESFVRAIFRTPRPPGQLKELFNGAMRMPLDASIALLSYPVPREHWRDIAWAFRKPLLYVVTPQFAEQAENLKRHRPGTQIEHFTQAGHTLFVDEPQRFNALIENFLGTLGTQR